VEKEPGTQPKNYILDQNYPNPFNINTTIKYYVPYNSYVKIELFNVKGEMKSILVNGFRKAGYHQFSFAAYKLASGIYFYRMQAGNYITTKKLILLK
jgi:hypothetical protein